MHDYERELQQTIRQLDALAVKVEMMMDNQNKISDRVSTLQENIGLFMAKIGEVTVALENARVSTRDNSKDIKLGLGALLMAVLGVSVERLFG